MPRIATRIIACVVFGFASLAASCAPPSGSPPGTAEETAAHQALSLTPVADGLEFPWDIAFLPGGDMLVTERPGRLRIIENGALRAAPIDGVPEVFAQGQGGLFGLALSPDFETDRLVYFAFARGDMASNGTALARARLNDDRTRLENVEILFEPRFRKKGAAHFGGRLAFLPDGTLLLTLGDGFRYMDEAQNLETHLGAILRLTAEGKAPADNPFVNVAGAMPEIWSYGHRNVQGVAVDAQGGAVYAHEHGPKGGDEINIILPGRNYGWPKVTYGVNYDGTIISRKTEVEGMEQPIVKWVPSIAPAGMTLYRGALYPDWSGDLLVSALAGMQLRRIHFRDDAPPADTLLLQSEEHRFRHIAASPDGNVYVLTDSDEGGVYRLTEKAPAP